MATRGLRGEDTSDKLPSSEDLKEENDAHSISHTTLIQHPPHICFVNTLFPV